MVHAANSQEMAPTAWAFGTAGFHDDPLFTKLAEKAFLRRDEFMPLELSYLLWGFATNGLLHEAVQATDDQTLPLQPSPRTTASSSWRSRRRGRQSSACTSPLL